MNKIKLFSLLTLIFSSIIIIASYYSLQAGPGGSNPLLLRYRFYRVLESLLSGFILGVVGSYLQSSLRNPLVDHYILGIGSGALFAAYLSVLLIESYSLVIIPASAVIGGLTALAITVIIAEKIGGSDVAYILSGIGINSLFSGASILLSYLILTRQPYALTLLVGSFITSSPRYIPHITLSIVIVAAAYYPLAKPLNALLIGDDYAAQLGYNPRTIRRAAIIISGIASSIIVSLFGIIGFIGLVSPHIARFMLGTSDNRLVIPLSSLIGGLILLLTDDLSRIYLVTITGEIPAGAVASLIGAPFFLLLIISRFKGGSL